jgi:hypothetical protein
MEATEGGAAMQYSGKWATSAESYGCTLVAIKPAATIPVEFDASALVVQPVAVPVWPSRGSGVCDRSFILALAQFDPIDQELPYLNSGFFGQLTMNHELLNGHASGQIISRCTYPRRNYILVRRWPDLNNSQALSQRR